MSTSFKKEKQRLAELCVYGFIRLYCLTCSIPNDLQRLCLLMYLDVFDRWNTKISDDGLEFDTNANTVKKTADGGNWKHGFGHLVIIKGDIQTWKIKISNDGQSSETVRNVLFGIIEYNETEQYKVGPLKPFCWEDGGAAFYAADGKKVSTHYGTNKFGNGYGKKWGKDDIITMTLDMTNNNDKEHGILSFKVNDTDYGIAFDTIDINKQYSMVIALYYQDEIQIIVE